MTDYAKGTQITLTATFSDLEDVLTDPTTVECVVSLPTKETVSLSATRASLGVYTAEYTPEIKGGHMYKFRGTGVCPVAAYASFNVRGDF